MKLKPWLFAWLAFAAGLAVSHAEKSINTTRGNLALKGYDPVAYFVDAKPVEGSEAFIALWSGAVWRFSSAVHRDLFQAEPEKYAPQFGGYCAWAVSRGYTASIDPKAWKIVNGRLYLNYSASVQANWEKDAAGNIARAETNWPGILRK